MKRHVLCLTAAAALVLLTGACNNDDTTGVPAISPQAVGNTGVLRNSLAFFTYQFSPSGDLGVMNANGTNRRRVPGSETAFEPAISPDGQRILFSRVTTLGVTGIYIMNVDGTGTIPLVEGLLFNASPEWSPDGRQVTFTSTREGSFGSYARISIINADGTGLRQVSPEVGPNDFAFDEGPTFSPDGTRLAFARNGILHVINVDGTGMTPLSTEDFAGSPAWSPDGQRIAYMAGFPQGIHVRNADGSNLVELTTAPPDAFDAWPGWSPDGRQLVFSRFVNDRAQIFTINADGSGATSLTPEGVNDYMPTWSPSPSARGDRGIHVEVTPPTATLDVGESLQFGAIVRAQSGGTISNASVLWVSTDPAVATVTPSGLVTGVGRGSAQIQATFANATGRATVTVTAPGVLRNVILYATEEFGLSELALVNPDGSGRQRLTTDGRGYFAPDISPDGRRIAFAGFNGIHLMNVDGSGVTLLVSRAPFDYSPSWSPDGSRIAFRSDNEGPFGPASRIYVVNLDGTGLRQLSPDDLDPNQFYYSDDGPTWSPDGSNVVFTRNGQLQVINVDGTGLTPLPNDDGAWYPDWSPDGARIAYGSLFTGLDLHVRNADGSNLVAVVDGPEQEYNPRWAPDNQRIVFTRVVDGVSQIFIINADGTGEVKLSTVPAHEFQPVWSPLP